MKRSLSLGIALLLGMALATVNAQSKTGVQKPPPSSNNITTPGVTVIPSIRDTQRIVMMVSDTAIIRVIDSVSRKELSRRYDPGVFWIFGYVIREKHNTAEGEVDPGGQICVDQSGKQIPCFQDYWKSVGLLDQRKKPLPGSIVIWQVSLPLINTK